MHRRQSYHHHVLHRFSYDYGTHFTKYQFSNKTEVRASNLLTEPDSTNSHFTLFGTDRAGKTVAVYLDLSANKPRKCSKYDDLSSEGDFELWSLSKLRGACMFGQEVQYYRRKVDHACTIEEAFVNTPTITKTCECTAADYECESGFFRNDENGECIPLSGYQESWGSCDAGSTALRAPYRRIPRSKCVNGVKLDTPTTTSCFAGYTTGAWFAIIVFPIAAVAALTLGLMRYRRRGGNFSEIPGRMQAFIERFRGVRYQPVASDHNTLMDDYA